MQTSSKAALIAAGVAGLFAASAKAEPAKKTGGEEVVCSGINACKGQGSCAGPGHACGGQNACKGQGHTRTTAKDCKDKGGKVVKALPKK